jgi:hypothetical protein
MPYCPKCRDEFQDWVKVCPNDEVPLVATLPPLEKKSRTDEPLEYVATAPNEIIAKMWEGLLKERGITSLLTAGDAAVGGYGPILSVPVKIHVLASKVKHAKKILAPYIEK